MKSSYKTISIGGYDINISEGNVKGSIPLVFLHGFTGSCLEWESAFDKTSADFTTFAIDLPGHGKSSSPNEHELYTAPALVKLLDDIFAYNRFTEIVLCGYSMGGRLALSYAIEHPEKIKGIILESSTAGIENTQDREARYIDDSILAANILSKGIDWFVDEWMRKPLFDTLKHLPQEKYDRLLSLKKKNNPFGLCSTLRGFSTGTMPSYWDKLNELDIPVMLITGSLDEKFTSINKRMNTLLPNSNHKIISGAGHNTHLEKPEEFINLVNSYLRTF